MVCANLLEDEVTIERRGLSSAGLSEIQDKLSLAAQPLIEIGLLKIAPKGNYLYVQGRLRHLPSFPQNQAAVHTVWILKANPLSLVRELALPEASTTPFWVDDKTLRFVEGDYDKNAVDYRIDEDGSITKTILDSVPALPTATHAAEAAAALNERGFEWVGAPGGPQEFYQSLFDPSRGNPVVSDDGQLIAASVSSGFALSHEVVFTRKRDGKWEVKKPGIHGFGRLAISRQWIVVASSVGPGLKSEMDIGGHAEYECRFFNPDLELVKGELKANAIDIY
jgi:hypothetical protein